MFIDTARITVRAGNGGNGAVAFHREKYIAAGGPDGGDGGRGGDVFFTVDDHMTTLMDFRYKRKYAAANGENGQSKRCTGKSGANLYIRVPRGTVVRDAASGAVMHDMSDGKDWRAAKGGNGGWGNQHFATPTRQAPRFAKNGAPGEEHDLLLELKLLADVGLAGYPNVGKSTLLSVLSAARPKIANYHFTTLQPNLGVVSVGEGRSFVMADIPGLIEGAAEGAGLGHDFLRHVDRCRLIIHVLDASGSEGRDPLDDFETINAELEGWNSELASRKQIVALNKCDIIAGDPDGLAALEALEAELDRRGFEHMRISAATSEGCSALAYRAADLLDTLPPVQYFEPEYVAPLPSAGSAEDVTIEVEDGVFILEGDWLYRVTGSVNFDDYESRMWYERTLREAGIFDRLEALGIKEGDTVSIYDLEFDYVK